MNKLEKVIELLQNIKVNSYGYSQGNCIEYKITKTKDLPPKMAKVTKTDSFWDTQYKVYFRNKVNQKKLEKVCKDKRYWNYQTVHRLSIGYNEEIFAEDNYISFLHNKKKKALDVIDAYLKSNGGK